MIVADQPVLMTTESVEEGGPFTAIDGNLTPLTR